MHKPICVAQICRTSFRQLSPPWRTPALLNSVSYFRNAWRYREHFLQVGLMVGLNVRSKADIYRTEPKKCSWLNHRRLEVLKVNKAMYVILCIFFLFLRSSRHMILMNHLVIPVAWRRANLVASRSKISAYSAVWRVSICQARWCGSAIVMSTALGSAWRRSPVMLHFGN